MKVHTVFLKHPNSLNTVRLKDFRSRRIETHHINCGFTNSYKDGYRESAFCPGYASYNSILFETSCILTLWEHMDSLFPDGESIMILHSDITPKFRISDILNYIEQRGDQDEAYGLTVPSYRADDYDSLVIDNTERYKFSLDPWHSLKFDGVVDVWDLIKIMDYEAWEFANDTNPVMIYSHQFLVSKKIYDQLGYELVQIVTQQRLGQCGLWTPHVFERIIAIRLAMLAKPVLLAAFSHQSSSGPKGEGSLTLYGPRSYDFYRPNSRVLGFTNYES